MTNLALKPFLLEAYHRWILANHWTPYLWVNAQIPGVKVPTEFVENDGTVILNLSVEAIRDFRLEKGALHFLTSFGDSIAALYIPLHAVQAIFPAEHRDQGCFFEEETDVSMQGHAYQLGQMASAAARSAAGVTAHQKAPFLQVLSQEDDDV